MQEGSLVTLTRQPGVVYKIVTVGGSHSSPMATIERVGSSPYLVQAYFTDLVPATTDDAMSEIRSALAGF